MRSVSKKLAICIIVFFVIFGFVLNMPVQASTQSGINTVMNWLTGIVDGIIGIISWLYRLPITIIILAVLGLMSTIAGVYGYVTPSGDWDPNGGILANSSGGTSIGLLGPDDIFFNKLLLTDANVFKIDSNMPSAIIQIRESIALWYYIMRIIAIVVLLGILIYIAIRMSISTIASEKASYKKMLVNWASSIGLVFLLHYLIVGIAYINSTLIEILYNVYNVVGNGAGGTMDDAIGDMLVRCLDVSFIVGATSMIVVVLLIVQTFAFLIYYIKRMLTISFLIIISPLITITYSIDKLGDGKAQALNTWMKEYFFTVIIQPFHCIIYMVFVSMSLSLLSSSGSTAGGSIIPNAQGVGNMFGSGAENLIAGLLSIFCIKFIWDAEKIFKNIFGIKVSETLGDAVMSAAVAGTMVSKGMNMASKAKTGAKTLKYSFGNGKFGELTDKFKESKFGKALKIDSESKDRKFALAHGENYEALKQSHNTEGIRSLHERRLKEEKEKFDNSAHGRVIKGFRTVGTKVGDVGKKVGDVGKAIGDSTFGKLYKRYLPTATGVAAAMIGGSAMYGSSAKTSLFEAGMAGYGSYKGMKSLADRIMYTKKENYTDNVQKSQATMAQIKGVDNDGDKGDAARMHLDATRKEKQGELSNQEIGNKEKEARKKIRELLTARDHMDKGDKNPEIDQIMSDIQNGIFLNNLDMDEIAKNYELESTDPGKKAGDDLRDATGEFAEAKLYKQMAQDNQELDDLMGQDGFYKIALQAWAGDDVSKFAEAENGKDKASDSSDTADTVEEQEQIYSEEIIENHDMRNELENRTEATKEERFQHIIEEQLEAKEAMKNGELAPDKLTKAYEEALKNLADLMKTNAINAGKTISDEDAEGEAKKLMIDISAGVRDGTIDYDNIKDKYDHIRSGEDIKDMIKEYLEKILMRQMVDSSDNMDKVGGIDSYQSALASMIVEKSMEDAVKNSDEQVANDKTEKVTDMISDYREEKRLRSGLPVILSPKQEKQEELLRKIEYLLNMIPKISAQSQIKDAVKITDVTKIEKIEKTGLSTGDTVDYKEIEKMINDAIEEAKTSGKQITTVEIFENVATNHGLTSADDLSETEKVNISAMVMQVQKELLNKNVEEALK